MRLAAVVTFAFLGACSVTQPDPCAAVDAKTSCIAVTVTGSGSVDTLDVVASGAFDGETTSAFKKPSSLPVVFAVTPIPNSTGDVKLTITGTLKGAFVGEGSNTLIGVTGDPYRKTLEVHLTGAMPGDDLSVTTSPDGGVDLASMPDSDVCTPGAAISCATDGVTLNVCNSDGTAMTTQTCPYTCSATSGSPHCTVFTPHMPITADMIASAPAQAPQAFVGTFTIDTDTGAIENYRVANDKADISQNISNIQFVTLGTGASYFSSQSFTFSVNSNAIVIGSRPLIMVASGSIVVQGIIDARAHDSSNNPCGLGAAAAPGGFLGGGVGGDQTPTAGAGPGGGSPGISNPNAVDGSGGGAGGGNAGVGGMGATGYYNMTGTAGGAGGAELKFSTPITGGSGGGAGSGGATGGPGGGAVQLVAGTSIQLGGGAVTTPVGINANGCGGSTGAYGQSPAGGGAGGNVLLESPVLSFGSYGAVTVNGGGGAGGDAPDVAMTGLIDGQVPGGAYDASGGEAGYGGYGGGYTTVAGSIGTALSMNTNLNGGGGGGAAGFIELFNSTGGLTITSPAFTSPSVAPSLAKAIIDLE